MTDVQIESMVTITGAEYVRLTAEIEGLRAGNRDLQLWWDNLRPDHARLEAENAKLRAALRWYADENNYLPRSSAFGDGVYAPHVINDKGWTARAALGGENG
jgi:hypothetical protein